MFNFGWASYEDEEQWVSLHRLIKRNNGEFTSDRQAAFFRREWAFKPAPCNGQVQKIIQAYQEQHGSLKPEQYVIWVQGIAEWSVYGGRGIVPIDFLLIMDDAGVARKIRRTKTKGFEVKCERTHEPKRPSARPETVNQAYREQHGSLKPEQYVIWVQGIAEWSVYGGRGIVPIDFLFIMGGAGVVRKIRHTKTKGFEDKWERTHEPKRPTAMPETLK